MSPQDAQHTAAPGRMTLLVVLAIAGLVVAPAAAARWSAAPLPTYPSNGPTVKAKYPHLIHKCGLYPLAVNRGIRNRDKNEFGSLKVVLINGGHRQRFVWRHPRNETICGLVANREDGRTFFPRPSKEGRMRGYLTDPSALAGMRIENLGLFFKRK